MGAAQTAFARANARLGVLAGIAAVVMLLAGLGAGVVDALTGAATGGLRAGLAAATGTDGAARWQIRLAADPDAQAEAAREVLDRMLVRNGATWSRSVQTAPVAATVGTAGAAQGGQPFGAVLLADPTLRDRADLVDGAWADTPESIGAADAEGARATTLHAGAAAELGLATGDLVTVGGDDPRSLLVVGTWLPVDANDPAWFGEPIVATGAIEGGFGPFVVDEGALTDVPAAVVARWTALPDTAALTPDPAAALAATLPNVEPALRDLPELGSSGLGASGDLGATLTRLLAGIGAVRAVAPLPVLVLAFAGIAALSRLATLLGSARRSETTLLRARGASAVRLAGSTALEVLVVGVPAAVTGVIAAEAVLALTRPGDARDQAIAWAVASVALIAAVAIVAGRAFIDARRPVVRGSGDEVGRAPRAAVAGGALLVAVAAAIALWQFQLYGSPLVTSASGRVDVDPVAVLAPVLVLLALSLFALGLTGPVGAVLERLAAARPALVPALPMRQLARRAALYASASFVTMLAVAGLTLTAAFAGAWQSIDHQMSALTAGGEVRVAFAGRDLVRGPDPLALADPFADVDGITADAPVFHGEVRLGSDPATLVAAPVDELARVAPGIAADAAAHPLAASAAAAGVALPEGASTLGVDVTLQAPPGTGGRVAVSAWLLTEGGAATRTPAGEVEIAAGGGPVEIELPDAPGLRLIGLQASLVDAPGTEGLRVELNRLEVDGSGMANGLAVDGPVLLSSAEPEARANLTAGGNDPLPVVLAGELAARISAEVGDRFTFRIVTGGAELDAVVAGTVPVVPTAGTNAVFADLGALSRAAFDEGGGVPAFGERWLATPDPDRVARTLETDRRSALSATTRADVSSATLIGPAVAALWAGTAGALALAAIALVALASALGSARFGEVVVLRALGVPPRTQSRSRAAELTVTIGTAIVIGSAIGVVTALVTARELAYAAVAGTPASVQAPFAIAWVPWLIAVIVFVLLAGAVIALAARSVRRLAARPGLRQEER
ncbi:ABC transporter permease [Agromyces neolithicus]|uniref:ABC transporter permease n=1 Tax=Agromyces neolithicus TaxID=269420 RepID=A0ABN2M623_9MICO